MLSREALVALSPLASLQNASVGARQRFQREERWAPPREFSLTVDPKVPASWNHPTSPLSLSSLWGLLLEVLGPHPTPHPLGGLHEVVGDLPLVLKQVFCLSAVGITCDRESTL